MNTESNLNGRSLPFELDDPTGDPKHLQDHISAAIRQPLTTNGTDTIEDEQQQQLPRPTEASNHHVSHWNKGCNHHNYPQQQLVVPALFTLNAIDDYTYDDIDDVSDDESDTDSVIDLSENHDIIGVAARNTGKIITSTAMNDSLANKNRQRCLPENNQKEETPKGTFADNDNKLTTTASRLAIVNNTAEQSCDMILFILAEEGLLPGDAHPENLARATVKVECEVESKEPYDHRRRFIFERYLEDRRLGWLWIKERLQALRMHQRLHNKVICPYQPPINPAMRRIQSMGNRGFYPEYHTSLNGGLYQPPVCRPPPNHPPMTPHKYLSEEKVSKQIPNKSVVGDKARKRVRFDLSRNQVKTVSRYLIGGKCAISKPIGTNNILPAEPRRKDEQMIKDDLKKARETTQEFKQEMTSLASNIPDNIHSKANLLALKKKFLARCKKQKKNQAVVRSSEKVVNDTAARDGCSNHHASCAKDIASSVTTRCEAICTTKQNAEKGRNEKVFHVHERRDNTVQTKCDEGASKLNDILKPGSDNVISGTVNLNGELSSSKDRSKAKSHEAYLLAQKKKFLAKCREQKKVQGVIRSSENDVVKNDTTTQDNHLASCANDTESSVTTRCEAICTTKQNAEEDRNCQVSHFHEIKENTVQIKCDEGASKLNDRLKPGSDNVISVTMNLNSDLSSSKGQLKAKSKEAYLLAQKKKFLAKCRKQKKVHGVIRSSENDVVNNDTTTQDNHLASCAKDTESSVTTRCDAKCTTKQNAEEDRNCQVFQVNEKKENTVQIKCHEGGSKLNDLLKPGSDNVISRAVNPKSDLSSSKDQSKAKSNEAYLLAQKKKYLAKCRKQKKNQGAAKSSENDVVKNDSTAQVCNPNHVNASCENNKESSVTPRSHAICTTNQNVEKNRNEKDAQMNCQIGIDNSAANITKGAVILNNSFVVDLSSSNDQSKANSKELYFRSQKENVLATCKTQKKNQSVRGIEMDIIENVGTTHELCSAHLTDACAQNREGSITSAIETKCTTYQTTEKERNCEMLRMNKSKENTDRIKYQMAATDWDKRLTSASDIITVNRAATWNDHVVGRLYSAVDQSKGQRERSYYLAQQKRFLAKSKTPRNNQNVTTRKKEVYKNAAAISNNYSMPLKDSYTKNKESSTMLCSELKYTASNNVEIERNDRMVNVNKIKEGANQIKSQLCSNILDEHLSPVSDRTSTSRDETLGGDNDVPLCSSKYQLEAQSRDCHKSVTATEQRHPRTNWTHSMTSNPINKKSKKFQLRERTERQECQNVDETCNTKSNFIRRRHCRSHSNRGVETHAKKSDVGKFNDLADYWNQKPRRRNRIRDLSQFDQNNHNTGLATQKGMSPSVSHRMSSANGHATVCNVTSLSLFVAIVCILYSLIFYFGDEDLQ